jgi:hypothetical protein
MEHVDILETVCVLPHPEVPMSIWGKLGTVTSIESQNIEEILSGEAADLETQRIGLEIEGVPVPWAFYRDQLVSEKDAPGYNNDEY